MPTSGSSADDLDAVRTVVEALKNFPADDQRRIIRWAKEKLGLAPAVGGTPAVAPHAAATAPGVAAAAGPIRDIRSFLQQKRPATDVQFATAVAYFYAFDAPDTDRKSEITASDLQEAARLSGRERLHKPIDTLHNAAKRGYLDRARGRGSFRINTVGENLVAMAMPGANETPTPGRARGARPSRPARRAKSAREGKSG